MLYKENYKMTSDFGPRILNGSSDNHKGIDFVGINSKEITATVDGLIATSTIITDKNNLTWQWGNYARLDGDDGYKHYFCHMSKRLVNAGQRVKKGDIIGIEGNTGYSFGSHCHYEVRNKSGVSVDPKTVVKGILPTNEEPERKQIDNVMDAISLLQQKGIIDTVSYWEKANNVVLHLDKLLIKIANYIL